jgi:hypothetical protein
MKALWLTHSFCSIFILIGAGFSLFALRGIIKGYAITNWPTVEASLTKCEFKTNSNSKGQAFKVVVDYVYSIDGQVYVSHAIHPAYSASSFDGHKLLFNRLKETKVLRAKYNEKNPAEAYLIAGFFSADLAPVFFGLAFLSFGVTMLLLFHFAIAGNSNYASGLDVIR